MAIDILMPALSPTMETGTLAKWMVAVGDTVRSGDVIAEIETDKATMEVEAVDDGVLASVMVEAGTEGVAVGTPIARLAEDGETVEDAAAAAAAPATAAPATTAPQAAPSQAAAADTAAVASAPQPQAEPVTPPPAPSAAVSDTSSNTSSNTGRIFASPLARRIAAERGVDLAALSGSGPHGRILRRDVEAASVSAPAVATRTAAVAAIQGDSRVEPNSQMRKII
ncbi:MAG: biotin/lipoyl-containing protein, partial [Rhodobiaceae bacterium]